MKLVYTIRWLSHPTLNVLYNSFWDDSEHAFLSCKVDFFVQLILWWLICYTTLVLTPRLQDHDEFHEIRCAEPFRLIQNWFFQQCDLQWRNSWHWLQRAR